MGVYFAGSIGTGQPVAVDERVVTAQAPAAVAFGAELGWRAGALFREQAERRRRYSTDGG